jgi:hypothetical protein
MLGLWTSIVQNGSMIAESPMTGPDPSNFQEQH